VTVVAPARPDDVPAIVELMDELDAYYGSVPAGTPDDRRQAVADALFGPIPAAHVLVAHVDDRLVGLAAYSYLWPAVGVTRSLFLKELFVRVSNQRSGVGSDLMRAVCQQAQSANCSRVEWTTEHSNAGALAFYASLGAPILSEKAYFRLDSALIERLAAET
jgi:GNAT superfamily N-acetyltransferase